MSLSFEPIAPAPINARFALPGLRSVSRLAFGAMRLTGQPGNYGRYADWEQGKGLLRRALELGVDFIDTAHAYGPGTSEEIIAEALHPYPDQLMIATKGGVDKPRPGEIHQDASPETLRVQLESSLRRLRVERIELYYLHRPDPNVPLLDSVGELEKQRKLGKIGAIGLSNVSLQELQSVLEIAPVCAVQNRYNISETAGDDILDFTTSHGIAFAAYCPLGAHPMKPGAVLPEQSFHGLASQRLADGWTPARVALRALLERAPNLIPIFGTSSAAHLEENLRALA